MALNLLKLCVGCDSVEDLEEWIEFRLDERRRSGEPAEHWHTTRMTKEEAYKVLGLEAGAAAADVRKAHRRLMQRLHPDIGGTSFLAARINEAKDVLLSNHN